MYLDFTDRISWGSTSWNCRISFLQTITSLTIRVDSNPTHYNILYTAGKSLRSLKIVGVPCLQNSRIFRTLLDVSQQGVLVSLETLEFKFAEHLNIPLLKILPHLSNLECFITDQPLTLTLTKNILEAKHGLKFIVGKISVDDTSETIGWTNLLNELCFRVTFGHQIIDSVPTRHLWYDRGAYSFRWPKGYYPVE
jgi:hypothetical protein